MKPKVEPFVPMIDPLDEAEVLDDELFEDDDIDFVTDLVDLFNGETTVHDEDDEEYEDDEDDEDDDEDEEDDDDEDDEDEPEDD